MLDNVASPAVRQKRSKLAPTSCQASSMFAAGTRAVNVVGFFMALLSFRGFDASSLAAQGEQRLPLIFNIQRGNAYSKGMDDGEVHHIEEKGYASKGREPVCDPATDMLEKRKQYEGGSERHHEIKQRWRVF